jgi:CheY-like chemotaxis protein
MREVERTIEALTEAQDHLLRAERLRAFGEMAGGVAHDFNNVLSTILGNAQFLMDDSVDEKVRDRLSRVVQAARDGADTLKRLQGFARADSPTVAEPLDPNELIEDVIRITRPKWKDEPQKRGTVIEVETDLRAARNVRGRASELREAFVNFVFNAVHAMPDGGLLRFASESVGDSVQFTVADTGVGFTAEALDRAFDPFFTTKGAQGTGLGLSVTYGIIARHGGDVKIESRPGQGATVMVTLPACGECAEASPDTRTPETGPPRRVLVVDDDATVSAVLAEVLEDLGHEPILADGGHSALELLSEQTVDVVVTDLGMDGMSGWELTDRIAQSHPQLPVVMLTGWSAETGADLSEHRNTVAVLSKPVDVADLCRALQAATEPPEAPTCAPPSP